MVSHSDSELSVSYPYSVSEIDLYVLRRDGHEVFRGTESDVWRWLHRTHSQSVSWLLRFEGYSISPLTEDTCADTTG